MRKYKGTITESRDLPQVSNSVLQELLKIAC